MTHEQSLSDTDRDDDVQNRKSFDEHMSRIREAHNLKQEAAEKRLAAQKLAELANSVHSKLSMQLLLQWFSFMSKRST